MADDLINCIVMRFINILLLHIHNALEAKCRHVLGPASNGIYLSSHKMYLPSPKIYGWNGKR